MQRLPLALALSTLLAGTAVAQITLPAFVSTYTAPQTRGFWFQAPTTFVVTGLQAPNEAGQPFQALEFIDLGLAPPPAYPATVVGTQLHYSNNTAGGSIVPTSIVCVAGNYYGVLGASMASVGSTTMYNSYDSVGAYAGNILGIPTTLTRFGTQFGIGGSGGNPCWSEVGGTLCRVNVFVSGGTGTVLATNSSIGAGCIASYASFYENFATAAGFDLANTAITMINTGSGYAVTPGGTFLPVGAIQPVPTVLALGDDTAVTQAFTTGSFPGSTGLTVCSNGFVSTATGNGTGFTPTVATLLGDPATSFRSWHDYNPSIAGSGTVKWEESAAVTVVTWDGVWDYAGTSVADASNLQFQFYPNGNVVIAWGAMSLLGASGTGHLVGYSPGGASANPGNTDISALVALVLGSTDIIPLGLTATSRPVTGTNWNLTVNNIPATQVIGVDIFGVADPGINDLFFLGMPGCGLRASLDFLSAYPGGGPHSYSLAIPANPTLLNVHIYTTSASFQVPPVNAFGAITSNGIDGKIGDY
ncbi:MAG: hypothetical protein WAT39_04685 [Planctomycetota bacterium]